MVSYSLKNFLHQCMVTFIITCVLSKSLVDRDNPDPEEEVWLADQSNYYTDYMGDAPETVADTKPEDLCPLIPEPAPKSACNMRVCNDDTDCKRRKDRCCFNGCVKTCLRQLDPPVFVDWIREPRRRLRSGISWLVSGPDTAQDLEPCSTTPFSEEEDPLLCPHGYICHVEETGDVNLKMPNRGHCIPESDDQFLKLGVGQVSRDMKDNSCLMNQYVLLDGANMFIQGKRCICRRGFLTCLRKRSKSKQRT